MSIEEAIAKLADALNNLAGAVNNQTSVLSTGAGAPAAEVAATDPTKASRGRKAKTDTPAAAPDQPAGADTASPAPASTSGPAAAPQSGARTTVDAGTGQTVEVGGALDRNEVKALGVKLTTLNGGNDKLRELLKAHSPEGAEVKFGSVPDEALPTFKTGVEEAIASLSAMED